jgi:hypothetical protein
MRNFLRYKTPQTVPQKNNMKTTQRPWMRGGKDLGCDWSDAARHGGILWPAAASRLEQLIQF